MQKPAAAGDSALGTARRPPAPHTCIGAQQQSHVARRRGRAQPDGRGAPQAAPAARPPWEWPGRRPGAGRGGFFTNCRILVLPPTIGEHANDPRAFSLWGWRERSEQPAPKGKRKGVVCVRAKGGGKTRILCEAWTKHSLLIRDAFWKVHPTELTPPGVGWKWVVFACFPGKFPPTAGAPHFASISPPSLKCFQAVGGAFSGEGRGGSCAPGPPKPQNIFSGAILIGNTQGIGGVPGGHFPRRPAVVPGPKCDRSRCISARAGAGRPGAARPGPAAPGWAARSRPAKFAVRNFP